MKTPFNNDIGFEQSLERLDSFDWNYLKYSKAHGALGHDFGALQ